MRLGGLVMGLIKIRIGDYFVPYSCYCGISNLSNDDISGINREKEFFEPSHQVGSDTSKYKVVPPKYFACNLMHVGRDIVLPIALNHTDKNKIVSPAYNIFRIIENDVLDVEYFFILLKSQERDRYFWFYTDSSVRDGLTWDEFCNMEIELPPIEIQQKYVDIYNAMVENQQSYETGLEDLKLVCDGYIEDLEKDLTKKKLGHYIEVSENTNIELKYGLEDVRGISIEKKFMYTKANMDGVSLKPYKTIGKDEFAYVTVTSRNGEKISLAHNEGENTYICSSSYIVFRVKNKKELNPSFLSMLFNRTEFDRYARFNSWGSARETFDWNEMCDVEIPVPDIDIQEDIVSIFKVYNQRKLINDKLKEQIKDICPILIKGSIEEATKEA